MPEEKDYDSMSIEELEAESSNNPAEKPLPEPEAEAEEPEEQEPEGKKHAQTVPYERFDEVNRAKQHAENLLQQYHNAAIQAQMQKPQPQATPTEIAEYQTNMELLKPYLQPLYAELQDLKSRDVSNQVEKLANQAEQYVRKYVPDFDALAPELFAEIQAKPKALQDLILGNPDLVIEYANMVKLKKGAGAASNETNVKQELKKRAISESRGSSVPAPRSTTKLDPAYERVILNGTPQELLEFERKMGKR